MAAGAAAGGLIGLLSGAPLLAVPGVGPELAVGPLATGLTGAVVGGFLGAMSRWGVADDHVSAYQKRVQDGKVLIVANGRPDQVARAHQSLRESDPEELHLHARTSGDADEIMGAPDPQN